MIDEKEIQEYAIKMTGKAFLPEPLEISHNYEIKAEGSITGCNETDLQNGKHLKTYRFEPVLVSVVAESGKTIKAKDVRRRSQQLRGALFKKWRDDQINTDFEEYYDREMLKIIRALI